MLLMACSAAAYETFLSLTINSLTCDGCTGTLTGITGASGWIGVSSSSDCSSPQGKVEGLNTITRGQKYTTSSVDLAEGQKYYACYHLESTDVGACVTEFTGSGTVATQGGGNFAPSAGTKCVSYSCLDIVPGGGTAQACGYRLIGAKCYNSQYAVVWTLMYGATSNTKCSDFKNNFAFGFTA